ncbi:RNA polymerase sigma-70 factor, ECF subfamily [Mucilaginibacter mallensis]|uniref:RNA polymerase sigma-70 factor, ECF subfamily n=1 Tax=Mucilaginibacter mallensis TaxID=652787 RepID=A0A1H1PVY6_MUCMA|nr:RNA polymerase sigma-70 factor [Mucilaginibacter mallensis]SDS15362.1 RNA polymerase sigma-70 factor, ECF subfamily [Mucilaginibacter mallensis]
MDSTEITAGLTNKTEVAFEHLFKKHFRELHAYGFSLLKDWDAAEEVVQAIFLKLWEKNEWVHIQISIKSYLYKSVYHDCLNYMRRQKIHLKYQTHTVHVMENRVDNTDGKIKLSEMEQHLDKALDKLPEKCRAIFHLSRFEHLKYHEIANQLEISIKTVETHMGKALRILRKEMKEFLPLIALMIFNMFRS